jgi:hypothetical protein
MVFGFILLKDNYLFIKFRDIYLQFSQGSSIALVHVRPFISAKRIADDQGNAIEYIYTSFASRSGALLGHAFQEQAGTY